MENETRNGREGRLNPHPVARAIRNYGLTIGFTVGYLGGLFSGTYGRVLESKSAEEIRKTRVEAILEYAPQRAYLGDVDADGYADIIVRNGTTNPTVFRNNWADQFYSEGELTDNGMNAGIMRERAIEAALRPDYLVDGHPPVWTVKVAERIEQEKKDHDNNWKEVEQK